MADKVTESIDLTTCSVCFFEYNEEERKPKFLTCHHTACLNCLDSMSAKTHFGENQGFVVSCPLCRQNTTWLSNLSGGAHNLPNNPYALHMVGLLKKKQSEQLKLDSNWCLTCAALISPKCQKEHSTVFIDSGKIAEAEALQSLMDSYKSNLVEAIAKRKDIDNDLNGLLRSIEKIVEELKGDIETNEIEIALLASMLADVENKHSLEVSVQSLKEKLQAEVEVSKNSLRLATDAMIRNFLRVRIDLRNTANESVPVCARFASGFQYAKHEIKNRPGLRSKLNLINYLVVSVNKEELNLPSANEAAISTAEKPVASYKLLSTAECSSTQSLPSIGSDISTFTTGGSVSTNKLVSLPHFVSVPPTSFIIRARKAKEILGEITIQTSFDQMFVNALSDLCLCKPVISNHVTQAEPDKILSLACENSKFRPLLPPMESQRKALRNLDVGISMLIVENGRLRRWGLSFLLTDLNWPTTAEMAYFGTVTSGDRVLRSLCLKQKGSEKAGLNFILEN